MVLNNNQKHLQQTPLERQKSAWGTFENTKSGILWQIDLILKAQEEQKSKKVNSSIWLQQLEAIYAIDWLEEFYEEFFVFEKEITYEEQLPRFVNYFWNLLNDLDKMQIFCEMIIDYYYNKSENKLRELSQSYSPDYLKTTWKINLLRWFQDKLIEIRKKITLSESQSEESKYFAYLVMNWKIKVAYDYANTVINTEYKNYVEIYSTFYWYEVKVEQRNLPKYKVWTKQITKLKKDFPEIFYN